LTNTPLERDLFALTRRWEFMLQPSISLNEVSALRAHRWRTTTDRRVSSESEALCFIRELGFALLMPIAGADMPSIHTAVQEEWSWWDWKQTLPERKACYYAKVLRRRGTFISWDWFPCFYVAYADPRSYEQQYREGLLDRDEKRILDLLSDMGPLMTRDIRLAFGPRSKENTRRVKAILVELQTRFLITAAGGETTGWSHHRWDLVQRWVNPRVFAETTQLSPDKARVEILDQFIQIVYAATPADIGYLFGWSKDSIASAVSELIVRRRIRTAIAQELNSEVLVPATLMRQPVQGNKL